MKVKETGPRRVGISELPGRIEASMAVTLDECTATRLRLSTRENSAIVREMLKGPPAFEDEIRPVEGLARRIVESHGGVRGGGLEELRDRSGRPVPGSLFAGYALRRPDDKDDENKSWPEEGTTLRFAIDVLNHVSNARWFAHRNQIEAAMAFALRAGLAAKEAALKTDWEKHALRGQKVDPAKAARTNREKSEQDNATLYHDFKRIRASSDAPSALEICDRILDRIVQGKLRLEKAPPPTAEALQRRLQRYSKDLP